MPPRTQFLDDVPRGINMAKGLVPWSCGCGQVDNWLCRPRCLKCNREAPARIAADARRIAERTRRERAERGRRGGDGDRTAARGRSRERQARGGDDAPKSQARSSDVEAELRRQLADERKARADERKAKEDLQRKLASRAGADSAVHGTTDDADATDRMDDGCEDSDHDRERKQQQLSDAISSLEKVVPASDAKLAELRAEHDAIARARREGKPLKAQLLALERKLGKKKALLKKLEEEAADARAEMEAATIKVKEVDDKCGEATREIESLEEEKRGILRRELAEEAPVPAARSDDDYWEGTVDAIRCRLAAPGTDPQLAVEIGAIIEALRQRCTLLQPRPQVQPAEPAPTGGKAAGERQQQHQQQQQQAAGAGPTSAGAGPGAAATAAAAKPAPNGGAPPLPADAGPKPAVAPPPSSRGGAGAAASSGGGAAQPTGGDGPTAPPPAGIGGPRDGNTADDPELLEDADSLQEDMDVDVNQAVLRLPRRFHQRILSALALGRTGADDSEGEERRDRDRTPRATKADEKRL